MNKKAFSIVFFLLTGAPSLDAAEGPYPGKIAPDFTLTDLEGRAITLKSLYEKGPVWLSLFTTWCKECLYETPLLVETSKQHPEIQFLAVSLMEEREEAQRFKTQYLIPYPVLLDSEGEILDLYKIQPIPVNFGIGKGGTILFRRQSVEAVEMPDLLRLFSQGPQSQAVALGSLTSFKNFPWLASFMAGILTFFSPCILPLIPVYISLLGGFGLESLLQKQQTKKARLALVAHTGVFVLGFGGVFTLLGATASAVGQAFMGIQDWIRLIGGALMIIFGLHLSGVFKILPFYREWRFEIKNRPTGLAGAFLMGVVFAAGWTPCVGPVLSTILLYSASEATINQGIALLAVFSAGIGIPFLAASAFLAQFHKFSQKIKPYFGAIETGAGVLLMILGVLLLTNKFSFLVGLLPNFTLL